MTHSYPHMLLAQAKIDDLRRQAEKARLASDARATIGARVPVAGALVGGSVTLRPCRAEDRVLLARLAALDGRDTPSGPVLVAEVSGELRAALSLKDGAVVTDPHDPTAALATLLRAYSREPTLRATASATGQC